MFDIKLCDEIHELIKGVMTAENKRRLAVKNLKAELSELGKSGELKDTKRFAEILYELSILDLIDYEEQVK